MVLFYYFYSLLFSICCCNLLLESMNGRNGFYKSADRESQESRSIDVSRSLSKDNNGLTFSLNNRNTLILNHFSSTNSNYENPPLLLSSHHSFPSKGTKVLRKLSKVKRECNDIQDCLTCQQTRINFYLFGDKSLMCGWSNGACSTSRITKPININDNWFVEFEICQTDINTVDYQSYYCGNSVLYFPAVVTLPRRDGQYGTNGLICKWSVIRIPNDSQISYTFNRNINLTFRDIFYVNVITSGGDPSPKNMTQYSSFETTLDKISLVEIYYLGEIKDFPDTFSFHIRSKGVEVNFISVFIVIGVLVLMILICSFILYKCRQAWVHKQQEDNQRPERMNNGEDGYYDEVVRQETRIKKHREMFEELLSSSIKPRSYVVSTNEFCTNCTICLEDFIVGVSIIKLECRHIFHEKCLKDHVEKNILDPKCPNCNKSVFNESCEEKIEIQLISELINIRSATDNTSRVGNLNNNTYFNSQIEDRLRIYEEHYQILSNMANNNLRSVLESTRNVNAINQNADNTNVSFPVRQEVENSTNNPRRQEPSLNAIMEEFSLSSSSNHESEMRQRINNTTNKPIVEKQNNNESQEDKLKTKSREIFPANFQDDYVVEVGTNQDYDFYNNRKPSFPSFNNLEVKEDNHKTGKEVKERELKNHIIDPMFPMEPNIYTNIEHPSVFEQPKNLKGSECSIKIEDIG